MRFQNGSNKVALELRVVQFWSEIILVISNQFEITRMISDQIALHATQFNYHYKSEQTFSLESTRKRTTARRVRHPRVVHGATHFGKNWRSAL